jgi:hypothetical protein
MRALDRCWCDFWAGGFFDPYNVSQWERFSVLKLADELERARKAELAELQPAEDAEEVVPSTTAAMEPMPRTAAPEPSARRKSPVLVAANLWSLVTPSLRNVRTIAERTTPLFKMDNVTASEPVESLPALRWEYDLRSYGLGVVIDFGWTRS